MTDGWRAWVEASNNDFFVRNMLSVTVVQQFADGSAEFFVNWGERDENGNVTLPTRYRVANTGDPATSNPQNESPIPIVVPVAAAKAIADALNEHFGVYAGADYKRLRDDYDRIAAELKEANKFIREQFAATLKERPKALNRPRQRSSDESG
jgi:hypothetical protein